MQTQIQLKAPEPLLDCTPYLSQHECITAKRVGVWRWAAPKGSKERFLQSMTFSSRKAGTFAMGLILRYNARYNAQAISWDDSPRQSIVSEARLNLLALEYGYRYRLDIRTKNGLSRTEFVPTLREARFVGMPLRRSGGVVRFFKINQDGSLKRHQW